jgi:succinate dehydrogenase/fumarate reductase flavoprotein subunit
MMTTVAGENRADPDSAWGQEWDDLTDVVVVGSGAAGFAAAISAAAHGASVVVLERADEVGGTTARSYGGIWVPNNPIMQARGIADSRDGALRYMARLAFPTTYDPDSPTFGLTDLDFSLLAVFYDRGAEAIDFLVKAGGMYLAEGVNATPDYHADLPENGGIMGRAMNVGLPPDLEIAPEIRAARGPHIGGTILVETLRRAAEGLGVRIRTGHRVLHVVRNDAAEVVGVQAATGSRAVLVGARRGVVFGSGGFLHNRDMARQFLRGPVFGGVAAESNTGDLLNIATEIGAQLGNMTQAWWDQCVVEVATTVPATIDDIWYPFGDSMIQVNRYGHRVGNEKQMYNERGQVHFYWNPGRKEYSNLLLIQIWDEAVAAKEDASPLRDMVPRPGQQCDYVVEADSIEDLARQIDQRLEKLSRLTGGYRLDADFAANLRMTIDRFNAFAEAGQDADFGRGESPIQILWQGPPRPGLQNPTMAPIDAKGKLYAMLVGAGALDTKGGPRIDTSSRMLATSGRPIPGLFGAGNCIASPMAQAYPGPGATIGPALVFGYIAGQAAASESNRQPTGAHQ